MEVTSHNSVVGFRQTLTAQKDVEEPPIFLFFMKNLFICPMNLSLKFQRTQNQNNLFSTHKRKKSDQIKSVNKE